MQLARCSACGRGSAAAVRPGACSSPGIAASSSRLAGAQVPQPTAAPRASLQQQRSPPPLPWLRRPRTHLAGVQQAGAVQRWSATSGSEVEAAADAAAAAADAAAAEADAAAKEADDAQAAVASHPLPDLFGAQELISELQDQDQFGKRGEGWTLAQVAAMLLVLVPPFTLTGLVDILATLLITAGLVFAAYGLISLGRFVSPLPAPRKTHELVTSGMYSYLRHPMYGGLLMAAFGLAVITRNETRLAMAALLWAVLEKKVKLEERWLSERYGKAWAEYAGRVKKFFPYVY